MLERAPLSYISWFYSYLYGEGQGLTLLIKEKEALCQQSSELHMILTPSIAQCLCFPTAVTHGFDRVNTEERHLLASHNNKVSFYLASHFVSGGTAAPDPYA